MKRPVEVIEEPASGVVVVTPAVVALMAAQADRLEAAKNMLAEIQRIEDGMMDLRERLFQYAWHLGQELKTMKEEVGHGKWYQFLEGHWPQLTVRNASRFLLFFTDNPQDSNRRNSADLTFSTESIRKFMWDYIPVKERPQLAGDAPVAPITHHLTFVNVFEKWRRQLSLGRLGPKPAVEVLRRDCDPVVKNLAELLGREYLIGLLESLPEKVGEAA